ncbi:MAG: S-layer homology domain-containing protein, partial [Candidatus Gracilibacteria bacterium]
MKTLLKSLLILILAISIPLNSVFAFYSDVPKNHEYYDEINALYKANLLPIPKDDKFNPDKIVNLGDLFEILLTFGQTDTTSDNPNINLDKDKVDPKFIPYIKKAIELGLLQNSEIDASLSIPKHKILNVLFESMGIGINYFFDKNSFPFTDLKSNAQLAPLAYRAAEIGIFEGKTPTAFKAS